MRVVVKKEGKAFERVCPYKDVRVANCLHCPPDDAPCTNSEGVFECVRGVLCADGGTPDDTSLCPYGALLWNGTSLYKCDLCVDHGYPRCYLEGVADLVLEERDVKEVGELVGWIVHGRSDLNVEVLPVLPWEARLLHRVLELYERTKGEFSPEEILDELSVELDVPEFTRRRVLWLLEVTLSPLGPLNLIGGGDIEEIVVAGLREPVLVYVRGKGWLRTNLMIWTEECFLNLVNRAGESLGRRLTLRNPRLNAVLPDGSRIHAVIPPVSNVHSLTVRRFSEKPLTPSHLLDLGTATPEQLALIWYAVETEKNVLIAGNTGSGKTTSLNAILGFVPLTERIIIVEEVPEIRLPHEHVVRMIPRADISMKDLIRDTLRMRPDRVVVGEIRRDEEAEAFIETVLAGQGRGSYATIHGRSVREVKSRLLSMGIREIDLDSIDLVVVQRRWGEAGRVVRKVVEVGTFVGEVYEALGVEREELEERARFLVENKLYDLAEFARRYGSWRSGS